VRTAKNLCVICGEEVKLPCNFIADSCLDSLRESKRQLTAINNEFGSVDNCVALARECIETRAYLREQYGKKAADSDFARGKQYAFLALFEHLYPESEE